MVENLPGALSASLIESVRVSYPPPFHQLAVNIEAVAASVGTNSLPAKILSINTGTSGSGSTSVDSLPLHSISWKVVPEPDADAEI